VSDKAARAELNRDEVNAFSFNVWTYKQGEVVSLMIHLGDRLGLYKALDGAGPVTAAELAAKTGLHERWLLEWLRGQTAAKLLRYHAPDRFELTPVGAAVLADESGSLAFAAGAFGEPTAPEVAGKLAQAFKTGLGLSYEQLGPNAAHRTERMLGPWVRLALVPRILPALDGVQAKLTAGAIAADVGCGAGVALLEMAKAFPASHFHGYDISQHALARAEAKRKETGLANARFHDAVVDPLPQDGRFALVTTFDCLHDMTDPAGVMRAIRGALAEQGTWLIADIKSRGGYEANVARNPMAALMYGTSVMSCMSSALSEPGGLGLGTLGFPEELARRMTLEAGFTRFEPLELDHPVNAFYVVRP
jgi:2-polyprenyl-3-methyl-5-hydroxy-6-metoxy-1,4-benzoquinol methylase